MNIKVKMQRSMQGIDASIYSQPYNLKDICAINCVATTEETLHVAMRDRGFQIIDMRSELRDLSRLEDIIAGLRKSYKTWGLDTPHKPEQYVRINPEKYKGFSRVDFIQGAHLLSPASTISHGTFDSTRPQDMHTDDTHAVINTVCTAILHCIQPAQVGGKNSIHNIVGAAYDLFVDEPDAVEQLFSEKALTRYNPKSNDERSTGPALQFCQDGRLAIRFSNEFCEWSDDAKPAADLLKQKILGRSITFKLKSGESLIMANNRVAHSRTTFSVDDNPRKVVRIMFEKDLGLAK